MPSLSFGRRPMHWTQAAGIKRDGKYRCTFEREVCEAATKVDPGLQYEPLRIKFTTERAYTPDVYLSNGIFVEIKGYFLPEDRTKMLAVKEQHPELEIRMVFKNPNTKLGGGSQTTYAQWCDKHGIKWAKGSIPVEWIREDGYAALNKTGI